MKKLLLTLLLVSLLPVLTTAQKAKKYAVKSGYLKLELAGSTVGTREIWWDDYGQKSYEHEKSTTTVKILGIKSVEQTDMLTIINNEQFWRVDNIQNKAVNGMVPNFSGALGIDDLSDKEKEELANELLDDMGGKRLGAEELGNYTCEVILFMGYKVWVYQGIGIKTEGEILGVKTKEMFSEFKPGAKVAASKFAPPADLEFKKAYQEDMAADFANFVDALAGSDEEEVTDDDIVPVSYPFEKFKAVTDGFSYPEHVCRGVYTTDGMHMATFSKGLTSSIMIVASAHEDDDYEVEEGYETFKYKGHTCYYSKIEDADGEGAVLVLEYPAHDMFIAITAIPYKDKRTMLSMANQLNF